MTLIGAQKAADVLPGSEALKAELVVEIQDYLKKKDLHSFDELKYQYFHNTLLQITFKDVNDGKPFELTTNLVFREFHIDTDTIYFADSAVMIATPETPLKHMMKLIVAVVQDGKVSYYKN